MNGERDLFKPVPAPVGDTRLDSMIEHGMSAIDWSGAPKPGGTCRTCGGSGTASKLEAGGYHSSECPNCNGTGAEPCEEGDHDFEHESDSDDFENWCTKTCTLCGAVEACDGSYHEDDGL